MRAFVLSIVLLVGSPILGQQPKAITNSIGMKLVRIHAGSFTMGSPVDEEGRKDMQESAYAVSISKSYYLGVYEVTQGQYETVMGGNPSYFSGKTIGNRDSSKYPVENLTWDEAVFFCKKLSDLPDEKGAGRVYRLPTEAEWEYACRATSSAAFCFGDSSEGLGEFAWFGEDADDPKLADFTHPVGGKKANRWGLHDMHGNVGEWCQDWFRLYPSGEVTDPQGPPVGSVRVFRGGSFQNEANDCRSARREGEPQLRREFDVGLRIALSATER